MKSVNSFDTLSTLDVGGRTYRYYAVDGGALAAHPTASRLPVCSKILLENLLRHEDGVSCTRQDIEALAASAGVGSDQEIAYHPTRVLMQDFTGVPAVVDLAAMRDALVRRGVDPQQINPLSPVDLVIDHSVSIDKFASSEAFAENVALEMQRNHERYQFLKWGQGRLRQFQGGTPGHRYLPSGQPGVPGPGGMAAARRWRCPRLPRHPRGDRQPHHDDQWPGCPRAGELAASKQRRPCWDSPSRC